LPDVSWIGIDYAFTLMNPLTMHHSKVIPEMYKTIGRESEGPKRLELWYKLRDSMGNPTDAPHQKVRLLKEYNRDRMNAEVFGGDPRVIELYEEMEARERRPSADLRGALTALNGKGKRLTVVSEVTSSSGAKSIVDFLRAHELAPFFEEIVTPVGRLSNDGTLLAEEPFKGTTKKDGMLYERLRTYLNSKAVPQNATAMVGDDPKLDVEQSKKQGFVAIQYTGIIDRGSSTQADLVAKTWTDLANSL